MTLELRDAEENPIGIMPDDSAILSSYGPQEMWTIHVIDAAGTEQTERQYEDLSQVEKYQISETEYNKRDDTFRKFKANKMKYDPNFAAALNSKKIPADFCQVEAEAIILNIRCQLNIGGARGNVKFTGKVPGLGGGYWVGIQLDEPTGDCDGSHKGKKHFECQNGFGKFCRPTDIQTGDFPPLDDFDEDLDEI